MHVSAKIGDREKLFDCGQSPIFATGQRERLGIFLRVCPTTCAGVRRLLPHQPGIEVRNRTIAIISIGRCVSIVLSILSVESLSLFRKTDFSPIAVALVLARIDDAICGVELLRIGRTTNKKHAADDADYSQMVHRPSPFLATHDQSSGYASATKPCGRDGKLTALFGAVIMGGTH